MSHPVQPAPGPHPGQYFPPASGSNGLAIAGFVLGLLALLGSWIPILNLLSIVLAVVGVVLAAVGLARSRRVNAGKGLAIAGLILSVLAVLISVLVNTVLVGAVDDAIDESTSTRVEPPRNQDGLRNSGEADKDLGSTRESPAPLGSKIVGDEWSVTINSVETVSQDSLGQSPAEGSTLIKVNLTANYTGQDEQGSSPFVSVSYVKPDGTTVDSTSGSTLFLANNEFDNLGTVFNGASVRGDQLLEVPTDTVLDGVLSVSPDLLSDDTFVSLQ